MDTKTAESITSVGPSGDAAASEARALQTAQKLKKFSQEWLHAKIRHEKKHSPQEVFVTDLLTDYGEERAPRGFGTKNHWMLNSSTRTFLEGKSCFGSLRRECVTNTSSGGNALQTRFDANSTSCKPRSTMRSKMDGLVGASLWCCQILLHHATDGLLERKQPRLFEHQFVLLSRGSIYRCSF